MLAAYVLAPSTCSPTPAAPPTCCPSSTSPRRTSGWSRTSFKNHMACADAADGAAAAGGSGTGQAGLQGFPLIAAVAVRLLLFHATTCAAERNWPLWGNLYTKSRNRLAVERAEKLVYVRGNATAVHKSAAAMQSEEVALQVLGDAADYE